MKYSELHRKLRRDLTAHLERNTRGYWFAYIEEDLPFGVHGEGDTEEEAKKDLLNTFVEVAKYLKVDITPRFRFVYDESAIDHQADEPLCVLA